MTDLAAIKARHVRQGHNERRGWLGSCADCGMSWPCDAAQLLALLADTADVGPTHVSTPSVEPAGLRRAVGLYIVAVTRRATGGTTAQEVQDAYEAMYDALLPTQASDSPEKP